MGGVTVVGTAEAGMSIAVIISALNKATIITAASVTAAAATDIVVLGVAIGWAQLWVLLC
jgi:hypothetical protein